MMKIPARFQRMAAAFEENSGSEHSPAAESCTDLSDLVNSFMERDYYCEVGDEADDDGGGAAEKVQDDVDEWSLTEAVGNLRKLFDGRESDQGIRRKIEAEAELACRLLGEKPSSHGFKRKLMTHFRKNGFDSGLCKSKWEKHGTFPARDYEYVDININQNRYIVEVFLVGEFNIARPTSKYTSLLKAFPQIYVGNVEGLKKIVKVMCRAMRESIKSTDLHIPPWRRNGYMQAKWSGSYKRTTNEVPTKGPLLELAQSQNSLAAKKSLGFEANNLPLKTYHCRGEFVRSNKNGLKAGHLSAVFDRQGMGM